MGTEPALHSSLPILYSFRRCPFAMRARLALKASNTPCHLREIVLKNKPDAFLKLSPKATVPVMRLTDGTVLEESFDIMLWSLGRNDPEGLLKHRKLALELIGTFDDEFKDHLDRYKYSIRYEGVDPLHHREQAETYLALLEQRLEAGPFLFGPDINIADIAIAPFIRQFANTDRAWFDSTPYPRLQKWLETFIASPEFSAIMTKYTPWNPGDEVVVL